MIDMLLERWVDGVGTEVELKVRGTWAGWHARLTVTREKEEAGFAALSYLATDPDVAALLEKDRDAAFERWWLGPVGDVITERAVSHRTLAALSSVLKGDAAAAKAALSPRSHTEHRDENFDAAPGLFLNVWAGRLTVVEPNAMGATMRKRYERALARSEKRRRRR
jgi:hypothetical protein